MPTDGVPEVITDEPRSLNARRRGRVAERIRRRPSGASVSTPSAPRATATGSAPTSSRCAVRARAPCSSTRRPARPGPARRGDRRCGVDPARRDPGPALPVRGRPAPSVLFDTELGGRLAGLPRVGLGAMVEHYLGLQLAKEHSAVDWSARPLPEPWLRYAALDVEVLGRPARGRGCGPRAQGKAGWAKEEFEPLSFTGPEPASTRGGAPRACTRIRARRGTAIVRELWMWRDGSPRSATSPRAGSYPTPRSPRSRCPTSEPRRAPRRILTSPTRGSPGRSGGTRRPSSRSSRAPWPFPRTTCRPLALPPSGPPPPKHLGRPRPGRRRASGPRPGAAHRGLRGAGHPGRERPHARPAPPVPVGGARGPTTDEVARRLDRAWARRWQTTIAAPLIARACSEHPRPDGRHPASAPAPPTASPTPRPIPPGVRTVPCKRSRIGLARVRRSREARWSGSYPTSRLRLRLQEASCPAPQ